MRSHGRPKEIWSDGGAPYNGHEWKRWVRSWGTTPKKTTPEHPPANGMVERFNQELKHVLHTAYAEGKDPEEAVQEYVAAYRNTPHATTGEKPSKLLFNRDVSTKLPRFTKNSKAAHHKEAQKREKEKKTEMKRRYDAKHRVKLVDIKVGDWAYRWNNAVTTTKGPWEPILFQIIEVVNNLITGNRQGQILTRDRSDWKLLAARPAHMAPFTWNLAEDKPKRESTGPAMTNMLDPDDDDPKPRMQTRAQKAREHQQVEERQQPGHQRQPRQGNPVEPPPPGVGRNRNLCPECHTLLKAMDGQRGCVCSQVLIGNKLAVNKDDPKAMCFTTATGSRLAEVAYIRGAQSRQPTPELLPNTLLESIERVANETETAMSPVTSDTESAPSDRADSLDDSDTTESMGEQFEDGLQFQDFNRFRELLKAGEK